MTFKEKLVILRKSKGLTQDEFASAVGVSRQAVYKWECGQSYPEVPKLLEMKLLLGISIDDLLDDSFDIPLPEKKRRKRISKEAMKKIEESVEKSYGQAPAAKTVSTVEIAKSAVASAPMAAPAPKAEPKAVEEETSAVKEEPVIKEEPKKIEEPVAVPAKEEAPAPAKEKEIKKSGFFGKIFGKK